MRTTFIGKTENGEVFHDNLFFRENLNEEMIRRIFQSWKQQNEFNYGIKFKNAKYIFLA